MPPRSVAILGLGLMGGSLARELSSRGIRVVAHDIQPEVVRAALDEGIVHQALEDDLGGIANTEIVIIATPVDVAVDALDRVAAHLAPGGVVTDVGSVKQPIISRAGAVGIADRFVGSHPLAGDHRSGWAASRAGLYAGTTVFLSPTPVSSAAAADRIQRLWSLIGARTVMIEPDEHDRRMAWISHLPQLLSSALANSLGAAGFAPLELGPGGRDMTRLAGSSPEMWTAICLTNAPDLLAALHDLQQRLELVRAALEHTDPDQLRTFFTEAKEWVC